MSDVPAVSWFSGDSRVSVYDDGAVEIQHGGRSYLASVERWIEVADLVNQLTYKQLALIKV